MKVSVLIIAHNEEKYIAQCIDSVLHQTRKPDEVILVVHNSTDGTLEIAKRYPISVIPYKGPAGITYARLESLKHVTGDIVLCTDGDSYVQSNWIEIMTGLLRENDNILVGSWIKYDATILGRILSYRHKNILKGSTAVSRIWGPSMAFWGKDKQIVTDLFNEIIEIVKRFNLSKAVDDYWLAHKMEKIGRLEFTNKTFVTQHTKERTSLSIYLRHRENTRNIQLISKYV